MNKHYTSGMAMRESRPRSKRLQGLGAVASKTSPGTLSWALAVKSALFDSMFELVGTGTTEDPYLIHAKLPLYSDGEITAGGVGSGGGGTPGALATLLDVKHSSGNVIQRLSGGDVQTGDLFLKGDSTHWYALAKGNDGQILKMVNGYPSWGDAPATGVTSISVNSGAAQTGAVALTIPTKTSDLTNDSGFITGITSSMVTSAIGYTPYNASNPNGYITSSALNGYATQNWVSQQGYASAANLNNYLPLTGGTMTGTLYYKTLDGGNTGHLDGHFYHNLFDGTVYEHFYPRSYEYDTPSTSPSTSVNWRVWDGLNHEIVTLYFDRGGLTFKGNTIYHSGNLTKSTLGLGNVENTALSTWAGSANITTLGTVAAGVWQGTAIADSYIASAATWNALKTLFESMFERHGSGTDADPYTIKAKYALWSPFEITAGGVGSGGGGTPGALATLLDVKHSSGNVVQRLSGGDVQTGDLFLKGDSTHWYALAKGSNGQILKMVNGIPSWGDAPATGVTSISVNSGAAQTGAVALTVPTKTSDLTNDSGFLSTITSSMVTSAIGYTPYNASNPNGYITSSALNGYLPLYGGTISGNLIINSALYANHIWPNGGDTLYLNAGEVHLRKNLQVEGTVQAPYINTHPENKGAIIPGIFNDIAFIHKRGGNISCYSTTSTTYTSLILSGKTSVTLNTDNLTDGSMSYSNFSLAEVLGKTVVIDIDFGQVEEYYSIQAYIDFGNATWCPDGGDVLFYFLQKNASAYSAAKSYVDDGKPEHRIAKFDDDGTGVKAMRIVMKYSSSKQNGARIAAVGIMDYNSEQLRNTHMSRGTDDPVWRSISPATSGTYDLGTSAMRWNTVFANSFKGRNVCIECSSGGTPDANRVSEINEYRYGLYLQANSNLNLLCCIGGGNVGIGTTSPSERLHVLGNIIATGNTTTGKLTFTSVGSPTNADLEVVTIDGQRFLHTSLPFFSDSEITAGGVGSGGGGSTGTLATLLDVKHSSGNVIQRLSGGDVQTGDLFLKGDSTHWYALAKGSNGQILKMVNGIPSWGDAPATGVTSISVNSGAAQTGAVALTVPTKTSDLTNDSGFLSTITSSMVTAALGYTPYSSANPSGFISGATLGGVTVTAASGVLQFPAYPTTLPASGGNADTVDGMHASAFALRVTPQNQINELGVTEDISSNVVLNRNALVAYAGAYKKWHDHFAFLRVHTVVSKQVLHGSTWTDSSRDISALFIQRESDAICMVAEDEDGFRFVLQGGNIAYSQIAYLVIGRTYSTPAGPFSVTVELSTDGSSWAVAHHSTMPNSTANYLCKMTAPYTESYMRISFVKSGTETQRLTLSCIKGLTDRKGNQGLGIENEMPFNWDTNGNIYPFKTQNLGTSGNRWNQIYAISESLTGNLTVDGNVGIGTTSPSEKLHVVGNIVATGEITAGSASDARFKSNIEPLRNALAVLNSLRPVEFDWNANYHSLGGRSAGHDIGFVAQEVKPLIPSAVSYIFGDHLRLDYAKLTPYLVSGWQSHEQHIAALERENAELKRQLSTIKS